MEGVINGISVTLEPSLVEINNLQTIEQCVSTCTVNLEIFARVLFSRNFAYAKFREIITLAKWQNHSFRLLI